MSYYGVTDGKSELRVYTKWPRTGNLKIEAKSPKLSRLCVREDSKGPCHSFLEHQELVRVEAVMDDDSKTIGSYGYGKPNLSLLQTT